MIMMTSKFKK